MRPILHTINSGGSGEGVSHHNGLRGCARRMFLDGQSGRQNIPIFWREGSIGHAYMEIHELHGNFNFADLQLTSDFAPPSESSLRKMEEVIRGYQMEHPRGFWGSPVKEGVEEVWPKTEAQEKLLQAKAKELDLPFLLPIKPDRVVRQTPRIQKRLRTRYNLNLPLGHHMIDYKFVNYHHNEPDVRERATVEYENSIQFIVYPIVWNTLFPKWAVHGTIVLMITKEKEPNIYPVVVEYPDEYKTAVLRSYLNTSGWIQEEIQRRLAAGEMPQPNHTKCFYPQVCPHFTSGACDRT